MDDVIPSKDVTPSDDVKPKQPEPEHVPPWKLIWTKERVLGPEEDPFRQ